MRKASEIEATTTLITAADMTTAYYKPYCRERRSMGSGTAKRQRVKEATIGDA
jgi:hypothetical protein